MERLTALARTSTIRRSRVKWFAGVAVVLVAGGIALQAALKPAPNYAFWERYTAGRGAFERGEFERALRLLSAARKHDSDHLECGKYLGQTQVALGDTMNGIRELLEYLKERPTDAEALAATARAYIKERNLDVALGFYRQACAAEPKDVPLHKETARALLAAEEPAEAARLLQETLRLAPADEELQELLARALEADEPGPVRARPAGRGAPGGPPLPDPLAEIERSRRGRP
jgi:predicted Zn-dependent protease